MDNASQPATKQDLLELAQSTRQELLELEQRLDRKFEQRLTQGLVELEQRLTETVRDTETNLLRAFFGYAETTQKHLTDLDRSDSGLRERLATVEDRLLEVEKRLKMPPAA
jgi:tRNA A37 N6-isopentenylltransferase MiaA